MTQLLTDNGLFQKAFSEVQFIAFEITYSILINTSHLDRVALYQTVSSAGENK